MLSRPPPQTLSAALLHWYDRHARALPWRMPPGLDRQPDPYRVWLSEIMLQQTTVTTVRPYFETFTTRWPTVRDLAAATEDDVLKAWAGLGYYARARNLKRCADAVVERHGGVFPADHQALRALPGIGDYTAAAIASIAFAIPVPVVDGNVERVMTRLRAIDTPLPRARAAIKAELAGIADPARPGDFAQAMMDLGAAICTPRRPSCLHCPWRNDCIALRDGDPERFPVKPPKKAKPVRTGAAFVIVNRAGAVLLEKRRQTGLLAGMTQVPTTAWTARTDGATDAGAAPINALNWSACEAVDHVFTHFSLRLRVWRADHDGPAGDGRWWSDPGSLAGEALPSVMKKAIACALPGVF